MGSLTLPVTRAYTTAIPFDEPCIDLGEHTVTGPITFTKVTTGAQTTFNTALILIADGANVPDFSAFDGGTGAASDYDNTAGAVNLIIFFYVAGRYGVAVKSLSGTGGGGDVTAPTLSSIVIENATPSLMTLTYNEALDTGSVPSNSDFAVLRNGSAETFVGTPSVVGSTVELTLAIAAANGDVYTLSYTGGTNKIQDVAGNDAANFTNHAVTNNVAGGGTYDADAQALYDAIALDGGSVPTPQKQAWSDMVDGLQTDGLYSKFPLATPASSLHPMLGSTLTSQKYNHCYPQDTDAAYRLTGTATHDAVGAKFNGTTQFLDSHIPVNAFAFSAGTIIFYVAVRNNVSGGYFGGFISSFNTGLIGVCAQPEASNSITGLNAYGFFCVKTVTGLTAFNPVGLWIITRDASGNGEIYHEGNLIASDTGFNADQGVTTSLYIGGLNKEGTGLYNPSDCKIGFRATCPNHFTSGDVAAFQARWNTFKTAASK